MEPWKGLTFDWECPQYLQWLMYKALVPFCSSWKLSLSSGTFFGVSGKNIIKFCFSQKWRLSYQKLVYSIKIGPNWHLLAKFGWSSALKKCESDQKENRKSHFQSWCLETQPQYSCCSQYNSRACCSFNSSFSAFYEFEPCNWCWSFYFPKFAWYCAF